MLGRASVIVLATAFQVISSQAPPPPPFPPNLPPQCRGPPQGVEKPHECCKIPQLFEDSDYEECGFKKMEDDSPEKLQPPNCSKQLCIMKKYKLSDDEDSFDYDAVRSYADKWSEANPDFKAGMTIAKEKCIGKPLPGPRHICEANKIVFCIMGTLFKECPKWEETEGCQRLKAHIEECSPFFPKH